MSTLTDKFDYILSITIDALCLHSIASDADRIKKIIKSLEANPNKKYEVIAICAGCATKMSLPVYNILKRHDVICPNPDCKKEHTTHDGLEYHSHSI